VGAPFEDNPGTFLRDTLVQDWLYASTDNAQRCLMKPNFGRMCELGHGNREGLQYCTIWKCDGIGWSKLAWELDFFLF